MRTAFLSRTIGVLLPALVAAFFAAGCASTPSSPSPSYGISASNDPRVLERGRYLALGPAHCAACHGDPALDQQRRARGEVSLSGGKTFDLGAAGTIVAPNITNDPSFGIGAMSDDEIVRSLRYGISRRGTPLAPFMSFADLSDEDLQAVLSFLRAQPPVSQPAPESRLSWIGSLGMQFMLDPQGPAVEPPDRVAPARTAEYGRYLAYTVANCHGCHTRRSRLTGAFVGPPFAGGMKLDEAAGVFVTPNLTPVAGGPIGETTEEQFIARFRIEGRGLAGSPMPWEAYARMTDDDLGAIYRYLKTLPAAQTAKN